ncbi:MAG: fibronectin type III domain-containing protein [Steroidobacteraceae bacterium]
MTKAKRGRGSRRGFYLCAVATLGFALSGCGGGGSGPASTAATSQASSSDPPTTSSAVTINWLPPTENTDGTPLTDLAGYDLHYGTSSGNYTQTVSITNGGIATYVVDNLTPGTYYFSVAAVNSAGTESPLSSEVSATVN